MRFEFPGLLLWSLAATIPILLHVLWRRTPQRIPWAASPLVRVAKNSALTKRWSLRQKWLLLLRCAILVALAVALANPRCQSGFTPAQLPAATQTDTWILVFDTSASMAYRDFGTPRITRAWNHARSLIPADRSASLVNVLQMDHHSRLLWQGNGTEFSALDTLPKLTTTHRVARVAPAVALAKRLKQAVGTATGNPPCKVVFYTDLGPATWDSTALRTLQDEWFALKQQAIVRIVNVAAQELVSNVRLNTIEVFPPHLVAGDQATISVEVENNSKEQTRRRVDFLVDGRLRHRKDLLLGENEIQRVTFREILDSPGDIAIRCSLDHDALLSDNERFAVLRVHAPAEVLCVGQARPVATALAPLAERNRFRVTTSQRIVGHSFSPFDCIVLGNVPAFSPDVSRQLKTYLEEGGSLIVFIGSSIDSERFNSATRGTELGLWPAKIIATGSRAPDLLLDPLDYAHPLLKTFRDHPRSGLLDAPIFRYARLSPAPSIANVALGLANSDPLVITSDLGNGRVILIATAADAQSQDHTTTPATPWSLWSTWPSFPPFIHQCVTYAVARRDRPTAFVIGDPAFEGTGDSRLRAASAGHVPPAERPGMPLQATTIEEALVPGIYDLSEGAAPPRRAAVNQDPVESDLDSIHSQQTVGWITDDLLSLTEAWPSEPRSTDVVPTGSAFRTWLALGLLALVMEPVLTRTLS